jgi:hypothetical protein
MPKNLPPMNPGSVKKPTGPSKPSKGQGKPIKGPRSGY